MPTSDKPIFIQNYREDLTFLPSDKANDPKLIFTPGTDASRVHSLALASDDENDLEIQFGKAEVLTEVEVNVVPGDTPSSDPWTIARQDGGDYLADGWYVGAIVTFGSDVTDIENRGDYRIVALTTDTMSLEPEASIIQELGVTFKFWKWHPRWSIIVPQRAGLDENDSHSGLDQDAQPWLDQTGDSWMVLKEPLWARLPANKDASRGNVTVSIYSGDY